MDKEHSHLPLLPFPLSPGKMEKEIQKVEKPRKYSSEENKFCAIKDFLFYFWVLNALVDLEGKGESHAKLIR